VTLLDRSAEALGAGARDTLWHMNPGFSAITGGRVMVPRGELGASRPDRLTGDPRLRRRDRRQIDLDPLGFEPALGDLCLDPGRCPQNRHEVIAHGPIMSPVASAQPAKVEESRAR
jgi:hypothetical protein